MTPRAFCEWGLPGVAALRAQVRVLVIVDVLSFSTAVDVTVARGASVLPFPSGDPAAAAQAAAQQGAALAARRGAPGSASRRPAWQTCRPGRGC